MQGLQIKLVGRLGRDKFHCRALQCFGDRFRIAIVILVTFAIRYFAGSAGRRGQARHPRRRRSGSALVVANFSNRPIRVAALETRPPH
jgi:hypothetical protein